RATCARARRSAARRRSARERWPCSSSTLDLQTACRHSAPQLPDDREPPSGSQGRARPTRPATCRARRREGRESEPWIDRLALEREDAEAALVHAAKRFFTYEPLERLDSERELACGERALRSEAAAAKPL